MDFSGLSPCPCRSILLISVIKERLTVLYEYWIQKRRKRTDLQKSLSKPDEGAVDLSKSNGRWVEAIVDPKPQGLESSLRIYFTAGAYCQISNAREAAWILVQIGHLYRIEAELRKQGAGVALRDAYRSCQSRPVIGRIRNALERWQKARRFLPQSSMGKAVSYALGQWESLEIYLQDAQIENRQ
jgi:hypothetical protein